MKRTIYLLMSLGVMVITTSCSFLGRYSTFTSTADPTFRNIFRLDGRDTISGYIHDYRNNITMSVCEQDILDGYPIGLRDNVVVRKIFSETSYCEVNKNRDTLSPKRFPKEIDILNFASSDFTFFGVERFPGGMILFFGPPFIPVIPNVFFPFAENYTFKVSDYHILIKLQSDTIDVTDLKFYRNKKEITTKSVNEIKFNDSIIFASSMYSVIENNSTIMYPRKCYLFTFDLRKRTTKKIEIYEKEKVIFYIKRKKKWVYEPCFFT